MAINFFVCDCYNIGGGCLGKHMGDSLEVYDFFGEYFLVEEITKVDRIRWNDKETFERLELGKAN